MSARLACVLLLCSSVTALAQAGRSEVSLGVLTTIPFRSTGTGAIVDSNISGGGLASYRFHLRGHSSLELSYGYSRATFYYQQQPVGGGIIFLSQQAAQHQLTASYVYQFRAFHRFTPFAQLGAGGMIFSPISNTNNSVFGATRQAKGAYLYGGGVDYPLTERFTARLQYRGLLFRAPDFFGAGLSTNSWLHMMSPDVSIVFHF